MVRSHIGNGVPQGIVRSSRILSARVRVRIQFVFGLLAISENYVELQIYL